MAQILILVYYLGSRGERNLFLRHELRVLHTRVSPRCIIFSRFNVWLTFNSLAKLCMDMFLPQGDSERHSDR